jgi:hypothetical protein
MLFVVESYAVSGNIYRGRSRTKSWLGLPYGVVENVTTSKGVAAERSGEEFMDSGSTSGGDVNPAIKPSLPEDRKEDRFDHRVSGGLMILVGLSTPIVSLQHYDVATLTSEPAGIGKKIIEEYRGK